MRVRRRTGQHKTDRISMTHNLAPMAFR